MQGYKFGDIADRLRIDADIDEVSGDEVLGLIEKSREVDIRKISPMSTWMPPSRNHQILSDGFDPSCLYFPSKFSASHAHPLRRGSPKKPPLKKGEREDLTVEFMLHRNEKGRALSRPAPSRGTKDEESFKPSPPTPD
jgi:hypothetical protein